LGVLGARIVAQRRLRALDRKHPFRRSWVHPSGSGVHLARQYLDPDPNARRSHRGRPAWAIVEAQAQPAGV